MDNEQNLQPEEENDLIELLDDDGNTVSFQHLATLPYEDDLYLVVAPADADLEADEGGEMDLEVVILKIQEDEEGNEIYVTPEEEEAEAVLEAFNKMLDEEEADDEA